jgi:hypothetical protein
MLETRITEKGVPPLNVAGIPDELKQTHRWVLWQLEDVQAGEKLRKGMKPPKNAMTGANARHNDFTTWTTYANALEAHNSNFELKPDPNSVAVYPIRGIGCVLGQPFFGIDIDDCRDPNTGVIEPEAMQWIEEANTFTEISPSGCGVHMWGHGEPPYPEGHRKEGREIYSTNRYLTVTGNRVEGTPDEIRRFTPAEVREWYHRVKNYKAGRSRESLEGRSDANSASHTSAKIAELMTRTDFPDLSPVVQSLLTLLMEKHLFDREKVKAEFEQSEIFKSTHWKEKFGRLEASELDKAAGFARENMARRRESGAGPNITLDEVGDEEAVMKALRYAWEPVLPLGKLAHLAGRSSEGKSPVTMDIIARVSRGGEFPNGAKNGFGGPRKTILFNIEDGFEDTILPRYRLAGGAKGMLKYIRGVKITKGDSFDKSLVALDRDISRICERARQIDDLGLIVIDPITNYLGKMKMNAEEEVRSILTPLAGIAEELDIVVITVGHLNKSQAADPLQRIMGATAFVGVARSLYLFGPEQDSNSPYRHVISPLRGEMHDSLVYHTEVVKQEFDDGKGGKVEGKVVQVVWDGTSKQTGEDTTGSPVSKRELSRAREAGEDLKKFLLAGKRSARECTEYLKLNGFDLEKLNASTVRKYAGVVTDYDRKKGVSMWYLPTSASLFEPSPEREKRSEDLKKDDAPDF